MKNCFDEELLQAFLDNELSPEISQKILHHVSACDLCANLLATIEEETSVIYSVLEGEINTLVPTQRLWTKINESIEAEKRRRILWQRFWFPISALFTRTFNPSAVALATFLLIFTSLAFLLILKPDEEENKIAVNLTNRTIVAFESEKIAPQIVAETTSEAGRKKSDEKQILSETSFKAEKANLVRRSNFQKIRENAALNVKNEVRSQALEYITGEENYVETIARLENMVNENKDAILSPSARFLFEKDLALVNNSIFQLRKEIRKNPGNEAAKQVLFASYQNKIDLLNSVTERGALIASLRSDF
jgi:hypothetical protein